MKLCTGADGTESLTVANVLYQQCMVLTMREAGHGVYENSQLRPNDFPKAETILKSKHYLRKHIAAD